ncbi:MAG: hypothetical protein E7585_04295 [Ruminococcaceae bacterium]|nr:hypothetical protein [Oscillospiraceae bacterium]
MSDFLKDLGQIARTQDTLNDLGQKVIDFRLKIAKKWADQELERLKGIIKKKSTSGEYSNKNGGRYIDGTFKVNPLKCGTYGEERDFYNLLRERKAESLMPSLRYYYTPLLCVEPCVCVNFKRTCYVFPTKRKIIWNMILSPSTRDFIKLFQEGAKAEGIELKEYSIQIDEKLGWQATIETGVHYIENVNVAFQCESGKFFPECPIKKDIKEGDAMVTSLFCQYSVNF